MRMSSWTEEIIDFMEDATMRSNYFEKLSEIVLRDLPPASLVCDAGCGLGQLALQMANSGMSVHAMDCSFEAVRHVRAQAEKNPNASLEVLHRDFSDVNSSNSPQYDRMVFSLSASATDAFHIATAAKAKSLVVVNKIHGKPHADDAGRPIVYDLERAVGELCSLGLLTTASDITLEFNQPFRTLDSAKRYFELFRTRAYPSGISRQKLYKELEQTDDPTFPYILPVKRHLAIFRIQMPTTQRAAQSVRAYDILDTYFALQGGAARNRSTAPKTPDRTLACTTSLLK